MCGRFFVEGESENELLSRMIREAERRQRALTGEETVARGEVFPTAVIAALAMGRNGQPGAFPMEWGFHRPGGKGLIINTRSETALDKPLFRAAMLERRCLVPCSWYFEWGEGPSLQIQAEAAGKGGKAVKTKYAIRPEAPGILYLAGIYRYEAARTLPALSILTRPPAASIAFIHDRMPVIFSEKNRDAWLDRAADPRQALTLCEQDMIFRAA